MRSLQKPVALSARTDDVQTGYSALSNRMQLKDALVQMQHRAFTRHPDREMLHQTPIIRYTLYTGLCITAVTFHGGTHMINCTLHTDIKHIQQQKKHKKQVTLSLRRVKSGPCTYLAHHELELLLLLIL